jgi:hypothetical protein
MRGLLATQVTDCLATLPLAAVRHAPYGCLLRELYCVYVLPSCQLLIQDVVVAASLHSALQNMTASTTLPPGAGAAIDAGK